MNYSRRQLEALGEPLGESVTRLKDGGFGRVYGGGGGGGGSQPANTTQNQIVDLPDWAKGYAQDVLSKGQALTDTSQNPYQAYTQPRIADLSSLQQTAMGSVASPEAFGQTVQGYMSPYMQNVVDVQKRAAREQAGIQAGALNARAAQAGAFGGSGIALQRAAGQRDLSRQLDEIQKMGSQAAYQQGVQQANTAIGQQTQLGALQQQQAQRPLDIAYQDFLTQKNYPYQQLSYMANLVRGTPMGMSTQSQVYQAPGSLTGQIAGLGIGAMGMKSLGMFAEGGSVDEYADGGSIMDKFNDPAAMASEMDKLSDDQLRAIMQAPSTRAEAIAAQEELAMRASERGGMGAAFNQLPTDNQQNIIRAAGGGILAFAGNETGQPGGGSWVSDPNSGEMVWEPERRGIGQALADLIGWKKGLDIDPLKDRPELKAALNRGDSTQTPSAYARGQDAADAEGGVSLRLPKTGSKASDTKTGKQTPGVTATAAPAKEVSFLDDLRTAQEFFKNPEADADRKALTDLIAKQGERGEDIRKQGLGNALAQFGFNMAAQAAKPGQPGMGGLGGILRSAAAASPALAESAARTQQLAAAAADNNLKMQIEMRKYNIAESKNDRTGMISAAQNIRMMRQQQSQLDETIRHNKASEAIASSRASQSTAGLKAFYSGMGQARQLASREATKLWSDPIERSKLEKSGVKSYDQLLQQRIQQHMKYAMPIYGVTPDDSDED